MRAKKNMMIIVCGWKNNDKNCKTNNENNVKLCKIMKMKWYKIMKVIEKKYWKWLILLSYKNNEN